MTVKDHARVGLWLAGFCCCLGLVPAHAQIGGTSVPGPVATPAKRNSQQQSAPAALPGTVGGPAAPVPTNPAARSLSPDAALFDAIDRGDIAGARAAISRGASLSARNILGQTPLDVSVDLGRNDITFLLLSLRNAGQVNGAPPPVPAALPARPAQAPAPAKRTTIAQPGRPARLPVLQVPRLFAADGGTPAPAAGFLGYGTRTP